MPPKEFNQKERLQATDAQTPTTIKGPKYDDKEKVEEEAPRWVAKVIILRDPTLDRIAQSYIPQFKHD